MRAVSLIESNSPRLARDSYEPFEIFLFYARFSPDAKTFNLFSAMSATTGRGRGDKRVRDNFPNEEKTKRR